MKWPIDIESIQNPETKALLLMLQAMFSELQSTIDRLLEENAQLKKMLFGQKSERKGRVPSPRKQLKTAKHLSAEEEAAKKKKTQEKRRKKLRLIKRVIEVPAELLACLSSP